MVEHKRLQKEPNKLATNDTRSFGILRFSQVFACASSVESFNLKPDTGGESAAHVLNMASNSRPTMVTALGRNNIEPSTINILNWRLDGFHLF